MTARGSKLRVVVLRDPGFRLDGDATLGEFMAVLAEDPILVVTEGASGYGESIRTLRAA